MSSIYTDPLAHTCLPPKGQKQTEGEKPPINPRKAEIRFNISGFVILAPVVLFLYILPTCAAFAAGSPFELEIRDLEKNSVKPPVAREKAKRRASKPSRRVRASQPKPVEVEQQGEYLKYTIRPGDHIYKVLTTRFGLSSARAEQLIPGILRLNGISNIARLQIGQVILIPAAEVKSGTSAKTEPAVAVPSLPGKAASEKPKAAVLPPVEQGLIERIRDLWVRLFPERGPSSGEIREKTIDNLNYPVVKGADLGDIIVTRKGLPPVFANISGAQPAITERVVTIPADGSSFAGPLLKGAGFEKVEENAPITFGVDPKVTFMPDFTVVKRIPGTETREKILLFTCDKGCPSRPEALSAYLSGKGYRLVTLSNGASEKPSSGEGAVLPLTSTDPEKLVDTMMDALALTWSKSHPVEIVLDQKEGYRIGVKLDRYFEDQGERYFVDLGRDDATHETLMRLVEISGYRRIPLDPKAGPKAVADQFLKAMQIPSEYGKRIFTSIPDGRLAIETSGILFNGRSTPGKHFLVADPPLDKSVCDLLTAGQWSAK